MNDNDKILDKIQKLLKLSHSNNVNEAASAYARAQELLVKHRLTMADVHSKEENKTVPIICKNIEMKGSSLIQWKTDFIAGLAKLNQCRILCIPKAGNYEIFGSEEDIEIVQYLFFSCIEQIDRLCKIAIQLKLGSGKSFANNFKMGAAATVRERLAETKKTVEQEVNNSTAMIWLSNQITLVNQFVEKTYPSIGNKKPTSGISQKEAYLIGKSYGNHVALHKGLS